MIALTYAKCLMDRFGKRVDDDVDLGPDNEQNRRRSRIRKIALTEIVVTLVVPMILGFSAIGALCLLPAGVGGWVCAGGLFLSAVLVAPFVMEVIFGLLALRVSTQVYV